MSAYDEPEKDEVENTEDLVSVKELANTNGFRRPTVFKVIKRLGIEPKKIKGDNQNRGQVISYISNREASLVLNELASTTKTSDENSNTSPTSPEACLYDTGVFYLISLEPEEYDPNRYKVGFANNINERMRQHKCSAPFAKIVKTWPCRRLWEKTAIECVTSDCEQIHTEVFRASSLSLVEEKCNRFFELMPQLNKIVENIDD